MRGRTEATISPAAMKMQNILTLVRHGETQANLDGVWHGSTDTPLTERGRRQAASVARYLHDAMPDTAQVYSSPLARARDTAKAIADALGVPLRLEPDLREFDLGRWEGKTYRELYRTHRLWDFLKSDPHFAPHGGESPRQVTDRLVGALRAIAGAHAEQRVVVVTHGGGLSMALAELVDGSYTSWQRVMGNCAVSELVLEPSPELLSFNYEAHLEGV